MVVRCSYCVRFDHFMAMKRGTDGTYVCKKCAHTVIHENKIFGVHVVTAQPLNCARLRSNWGSNRRVSHRLD
jgi:hypothetical protein